MGLRADPHDLNSRVYKYSQITKNETAAQYLERLKKAVGWRTTEEDEAEKKPLSQPINEHKRKIAEPEVKQEARAAKKRKMKTGEHESVCW